MNTILRVPLALTLVVVSLGALATRQPACAADVFGVVADGTVYTTNPATFNSRLFLLDAAPMDRDHTRTCRTPILRGGNSKAFLEARDPWRVAHGHLWHMATLPSGGIPGSCLCRVPLDLLSLTPLEVVKRSREFLFQLEFPESWPPKPRGTPIPSETGKRITIAYPDRGIADPGEGYPVARSVFPMLRGLSLSPRLKPLNHDILPGSETSCDLFVVVGGSMEVWSYTFQPFHDGQLYRGSWTNVEVFDFPFEERFHVAGDGDTYYFVMDSGVVLQAVKCDAGQRRIDKLWEDPSRPVLAMLVDGDTARAFVFGTAFYFRLAAEIDVKPSRDITQGDPALAEPMRTVFECARVLAEAGELKPPRGD